VYESKGEALKYFEKQLPSSLLSLLPGASFLNPNLSRLDLQERKNSTAKYPCILVTLLQQNQSVNRASEPLSIYCFDSNLPILRAATTGSAITTVFDNLAKVQGKFLPRSINAFVQQKEIFSAKIESVAGIAASDAALMPTLGAKLVKIDEVPQKEVGGVIMGRLIEKQVPVYPWQAKAAHQSGVVLLDATIGIDGKVHDVSVIYAPSNLLAASAKDSVSHWQYKPCIFDGKPVEVETTVNVIFTLGG
jgi:TonB family protein